MFRAVKRSTLLSTGTTLANGIQRLPDIWKKVANESGLIMIANDELKRCNAILFVAKKKMCASYLP